MGARAGWGCLLVHTAVKSALHPNQPSSAGQEPNNLEHRIGAKPVFIFAPYCGRGETIQWTALMRLRVLRPLRALAAAVPSLQQERTK